MSSARIIFYIFIMFLIPSSQVWAETLTPPLRKITAGSWFIEWNDQIGKASNKKTGETISFYQQNPETDCKDDEESVAQSGQILSVVGTVVSYLIVEPPVVSLVQSTSSLSTHTIDLSKPRGNRKAEITDYFPESLVLQALMMEKNIRSTVKDRKGHVRKIRNLTELFTVADGGCKMRIDESILSSFSFHHVDGASVGIQIGLSHGFDICRGSYTPIGLILPIPEALQKKLQEAKLHRTLMMDLAPPKKIKNLMIFSYVRNDTQLLFTTSPRHTVPHINW